MKLRRDTPGLDGLSISTVLLLWFLGISLIPCIVLTGLIWALSTWFLETSVRHTLLAIANAKVAQLEAYIRERRADLEVLVKTPIVVSALPNLKAMRAKKPLDAPEYLELTQSIRPFLAQVATSFGYANIYIFDVNGTVLFQLRSELELGSNLLDGPLAKSELAEAFDRVRTLLQIELSDFQTYEDRREPAAFMTGPIFNAEGQFTGVVALEPANEQVLRVLGDYSGLGETGEAMVARREGERITYISPPRFEPKGFGYQVQMGGPRATAMQKAVKGQRDYGQETDYRGRPVICAWTYIPSYRWGFVVKQDLDEAFRLIERQRLAVSALLVATVLIVVFFALWLARSIAQPIREAALVTDRVASGDLTMTCNGEAQGEAGLLLQGVRKMIQDLRSVLGKIQRSSAALLTTATEIASAARQQEEAVYDYSASTNEAAAAVNEISATSQELLKTMDEVNQVANQTAQMASTGQKSLSAMDQTMRQLAEATSSIGSKLSAISERAANINVVVTTITKVADQTNLLSINAAIEAEKAGEFGLGFLVVAREIRRLADQTAVATLDIERMVKEMQHSVSAGVIEMGRFSEQVLHVVGDVGHIGERLGEIISGAQGLHKRFVQVTEGMRVQSKGADQIREAMGRLSDAANQTSVTLRDFNKATERLYEAVGGLKDEVSRFTLGPIEPVAASTTIKLGTA
jgi:methyl-accepting chemotaxis protein WspA